MITSGSYCNLSLVRDASQAMEGVEAETFIFVGHSLGGAAAFCLAMKFPNSRSISFNGGAAPTNPVLTGPGPGRAVWYHVWGDIISSHMSPNAANVVRVKTDAPFASLQAHGQDNLRKRGVPVSVDNEEAAFQKWSLIHSVISWFGLTQRSKFKVYPIPGSTRWFQQGFE